VNDLSGLSFLDSLDKRKIPDFYPTKSYAENLRKCAKQRGAVGVDYTKYKHIVGRWDVFDGKCYICGSKANSFDHVLPISKGHPHLPSNLRPACLKCNFSKGNRALLKL
jgi:5-methylcytosine-specific restriction endonuclease McrA